MATFTIYPVAVTVNIDGDEYIPPTIVGGDDALGDGSDATYAEEWNGFDDVVPEGVEYGSVITATFPPQPGAASVTLTARLEVDNDRSGQGTEFFVGVLNHATGLQIGAFTNQAPPRPSSVTAGNTIYDLNEWTYFGSLHAELYEAVSTSGIRIAATRWNPLVDPGQVPSDYMLRIYELGLVVTTDEVAEVETVTRQWPRDDALGSMGSGTRIYPPPRRGRVYPAQQ